MALLWRAASLVVGLLWWLAWSQPASAATQIPAPPRSIADIAAILDQERPDPAKVAARLQATSAPPPAGLADPERAKFYAERSRAASALGRITTAIADVRRALTSPCRTRPTSRPATRRPATARGAEAVSGLGLAFF